MDKPTKQEIDDPFNRSICPSCFGTGDQCGMCAESGRVCPNCRGMRIVRGPMKGWIRTTERCEWCCEGNQINPDKEISAINHYLEYRTGTQSVWYQRETQARELAIIEETYREAMSAARRKFHEQKRNVLARVTS